VLRGNRQPDTAATEIRDRRRKHGMHVLSAMPGLDTKMVPSSTMREFLLRCRIPQQTSSPIGNIWAAHTSNSTSTLPKKNPREAQLPKHPNFPLILFFLTFFFLLFLSISNFSYQSFWTLSWNWLHFGDQAKTALFSLWIFWGGVVFCILHSELGWARVLLAGR
jgi:hypothetical protein